MSVRRHRTQAVCARALDACTVRAINEARPNFVEPLVPNFLGREDAGGFVDALALVQAVKLF